MDAFQAMEGGCEQRAQIGSDPHFVTRGTRWNWPHAVAADESGAFRFRASGRQNARKHADCTRLHNSCLNQGTVRQSACGSDRIAILACVVLPSLQAEKNGPRLSSGSKDMLLKIAAFACLGGYLYG